MPPLTPKTSKGPKDSSLVRVNLLLIAAAVITAVLAAVLTISYFQDDYQKAADSKAGAQRELTSFKDKQEERQTLNDLTSAARNAVARAAFDNTPLTDEILEGALADKGLDFKVSAEDTLGDDTPDTVSVSKDDLKVQLTFDATSVQAEVVK